MRYCLTFLIISFFSLFSLSASALPMDWHGVFGVDSTMISDFRRVENTGENRTNSTDNGSQEVPLASGNHANASFQSYIFRLNPDLIVNDSTTIKAEITSGYARGGRFGEQPDQRKQAGFGNALYMYNIADENNSIILNKFYAELYSDTATYVLGRHSNNWALGAVQNGGDEIWDRHAFVRDGLTIKLKLGDFYISPFWAKIGSQGSLTRATRMKEYGVSLLYDNIERDLSFGILYSKKSSDTFERSVTNDIDGDGTFTSLGFTEAKLIDLYFKKAFGRFEFAVEVPILTDEIGFLYNTNSKSKLKARAILLESKFSVNKSWNVHLHAGKVSGDSGGQSSFEAMYLNPNFQIANLLFRYNLNAVSNPDVANVYDSYITNTTYVKLGGSYNTEKWVWDAAIIAAWAEETANSGGLSFNHEINRTFTANSNQEDDLGYEVDLGFNYKWNNEVAIGGSLGYLFTGDYYAFTNDPAGTKNTTQDSFAAQIRTSIEF